MYAYRYLYPYHVLRDSGHGYITYSIWENFCRGKLLCFLLDCESFPANYGLIPQIAIFHSKRVSFPCGCFPVYSSYVM